MRPPTAQRPDAPWAKRIPALILENPGDAVYGAIAVGALLAAETPAHGAVPDGASRGYQANATREAKPIRRRSH